MFECRAKYLNMDQKKFWTTNEEHGLEVLRDYAREHNTVIVDWSIENVKDKENA